MNRIIKLCDEIQLTLPKRSRSVRLKLVALTNLSHTERKMYRNAFSRAHSENYINESELASCHNALEEWHRQPNAMQIAICSMYKKYRKNELTPLYRESTIQKLKRMIKRNG